MNLNQQQIDELLVSVREELTQLSNEHEQLTKLMPLGESANLWPSDEESLNQAMVEAHTRAKQAGKERAEAIRRTLAKGDGVNRSSPHRMNRMAI